VQGFDESGTEGNASWVKIVTKNTHFAASTFFARSLNLASIALNLASTSLNRSSIRLGPGGGAKFEAFCQGRFGIKKRYANEQIQGYRVADALRDGKFLTLPANTSVTTELGRLCETQPEKLVPAWRETLIRAEATGKPPDSKMAREVVAEILPPTPGKDAQPSTNLGSNPANQSKVVVKHLTTAKREIAAILDVEPNNQMTCSVD